ncbi:hypothetical protein MVEN_01961700 [Mycena venus]|uniref:Uncharacterized protein n=1 Tax=Mycena venus TaxID=2733690 RepID=A0A8H6XFX4_9AGAR|nr:hypothetical protein MVEN_01961700 [Mycena venus]
MPIDTATQLPNNNGGDAVSVGEGRGPDDADRSPPSLSPQQQAQLAALLRFRPSSRDVISGIAPHVFDDHRASPRSRSRRRRRTSSPSPERRRRSGSPAPHRSPLRLSAVISVDDHGAIVQHKGEENVVLEVYTTPAHAPLPASLPFPPKSISSPSPDRNTNKPKRSSFRIDLVLKTLVFRRK